MIVGLTPAEYETALRQDFTTFVARCFHDLNPQAELAMNWHLELIAAKLTDVRQGKIRRLIINLPPRHLKSLMASIAFPAWCLGHDPSAQILCAGYGQDLADKLARDCRGIMMSPWYRQIFPTRLAQHRQAVQAMSGGVYRSPAAERRPGCGGRSWHLVSRRGRLAAAAVTGKAAAVPAGQAISPPRRNAPASCERPHRCRDQLRSGRVS